MVMFLKVKSPKPLNSYLNQQILIRLLRNTIFAIRSKSFKNNTIEYIKTYKYFHQII